MRPRRRAFHSVENVWSKWGGPIIGAVRLDDLNMRHGTPSSRPTRRKSGDFPLYANDELRAMANSPEILERSVMMSSEMPSAKYSCSGSPDMFSNGSTAIDGLSGSGSGSSEVAAASPCNRIR